jgi:uncharacterized protein (DUF2336 family)
MRYDGAMTLPGNLINELEDAIAHKDVARRAETLRRLTDLFVLGSTRYSGEQIALFDDVMGRLIDEVEVSARAAFGHRLATVPNAPPKVMRELAMDNAIEVAGPVLTHFEQIDDVTLVESAKTKGQDHLLAISRRKMLTENVTDVLVDRGNQQVALSTAGNPGAAFSEFGYLTLVRRSQDDEKLAQCVWSRPDIPRQHLLKLFADASESVRLTLEATDRRKAGMIREMVAQAANQIQTKAREGSSGYAAAYIHVQNLHTAGKLDETRLAAFVREGKFDETAIALSLLCNLPIGLIERAFAQNWSEQLLVLAKAIDLSWETTKAMLLLQKDTTDNCAPELEQSLASFTRLQSETAKKAVQFYRLREQATTPVSY